jgi:hypothetical protein
MVVPSLVEIVIKFVKEHHEQFQETGSLPFSLRKAIFEAFLSDKSVRDNIVQQFFGTDGDHCSGTLDLDLSHCQYISDNGVLHALQDGIHSLNLRGTLVVGSFLQSASDQ